MDDDGGAYRGADAAVGAQILRRTGGAFFAAVLADIGALTAAVSTRAQVFHAVDTFAALGAVIAARAVKASLALGADFIVRAVFAFFAAGHADDGAV